MANEKNKTRRARAERRFEPASTHAPALVYVLGALGSMGLGAGAFGAYRSWNDAPIPYWAWVLAAGAVVLAGAIWLGTSGEPVVRVGDAGLGLDASGGVRRMPWYALESLTWDAGRGALVARGQDEAGTAVAFAVRRAPYPQAVAWLLKEARARVPDAVQVEDDAGAPPARDGAGARVPLDPVQVAGRRCAATSKMIAFESDGRVCPRCERVYHKDAAPSRCACGGELGDQNAARATSVA